jgi:7-cyano-7-deazaguanine synthase
MTDRDVILFSGGLDSTTLLASAFYAHTAVLALSVDYGQRHRRELQAATRLARHYHVPHVILNLSDWGNHLIGSALTDTSVPVPHGHYEAPTMAATIVPNRNATFLMAAVGIAQARGCNRVLTAVHAGDHAVYPDCRPEFIDAINAAARLATEDAVRIEAPFVGMTKTEIAGLARVFDVPIRKTWSCYEGGTLHCGRCGTCTERIEALREAGVRDDTPYAGVPCS